MTIWIVLGAVGLVAFVVQLVRKASKCSASSWQDVPPAPSKVATLQGKAAKGFKR